MGSIQLVKHLAARASGAPLLGYLERHSMLLVPLGAELPGLSDASLRCVQDERPSSLSERAPSATETFPGGLQMPSTPCSRPELRCREDNPAHPS